MLLLLADVRPKFVALDPANAEANHQAVMQFGAPASNAGCEPHDGVPVDSGHSLGCPDRHALGEAGDERMAFAKTEKEWAERAARHLKAELKRAGLTYEELAERLKGHGFQETKASIANKLARGTFSTTFFLASLAAMEATTVEIESL